MKVSRMRSRVMGRPFRGFGKLRDLEGRVCGRGGFGILGKEVGLGGNWWEGGKRGWNVSLGLRVVIWGLGVLNAPFGVFGVGFGIFSIAAQQCCRVLGLGLGL